MKPKARKNELTPEAARFVQAMGLELRRYREERGLYIKDAAKAAGLSESGLRFIETGRTSTTFPTLLAILAVYGKTPMRLLMDMDALSP